MGDQSDQPNEWNLPHQIPNGPLHVKQIKKKQKNKTFVKKSNASHPADPPPNGYRHFNGMSLRPDRDTSSHASKFGGKKNNAPLYPGPNIEIHQVIPVLGRGLLPTPPRRPPSLLCLPPLSPPPQRPPPQLPPPPGPPPLFSRPPPQLPSPPGPPPLFSRPPPQLPSPPGPLPLFSRPPHPPPQFPHPPSRFPFPPPHLPPRFPHPPTPLLPALISKLKDTAATTCDSAVRKSPRKVTFSPVKNVNVTPQVTRPEPEKPFKLSERTRAHLQLQMQEISKRYEMMGPEKSTWVPLPSKLAEKLGFENSKKKDAVDVAPPPTRSVLTRKQNTGFQVPGMIQAGETRYDILIDDPLQKDANINYAERYPNFKDVRALCLYQPSNGDDGDDFDDLFHQVTI